MVPVGDTISSLIRFSRLKSEGISGLGGISTFSGTATFRGENSAFGGLKGPLLFAEVGESEAMGIDAFKLSSSFLAFSGPVGDG